MFAGDNPRERGKTLPRRVPLSPKVFSQIQLYLLSDERSGSIAQAMLSKASLFPDPTPLLPTGVLVIRYINDCVSNDGISGTLTLSYARGTVHISQHSEFSDFGDSAVAPVGLRKYYFVWGGGIVGGTVFCVCGSL